MATYASLQKELKMPGLLSSMISELIARVAMVTVMYGIFSSFFTQLNVGNTITVRSQMKV